MTQSMPLSIVKMKILCLKWVKFYSEYLQSAWHVGDHLKYFENSLASQQCFPTVVKVCFHIGRIIGKHQDPIIFLILEICYTLTLGLGLKNIFF